MANPLNISIATLLPETDSGRVFDMTGRCAFAICTDGDFDIRILNEVYNIKGHSIFACMPFVNVEVLQIRKPSRILMGGVLLVDVLGLISRSVNSSNLVAIQQQPMVAISESQYQYLNVSIEGYLKEVAEIHQCRLDNTRRHIQEEIVFNYTRLIVAQVLKVYFTNLPMEVNGYTHRDIIFQQFMLDMYANCREQRNVNFYASRSSVSLKYFSTIVRQLSGKTPSEWIELIVAGEAKTLLMEVHRSIKDIAAELNFPDAPTFTKYFRRVTGMTPKEYRKSLS